MTQHIECGAQDTCIIAGTQIARRVATTIESMLRQITAIRAGLFNLASLTPVREG
jgi:hypothetical protein